MEVKSKVGMKGGVEGRKKGGPGVGESFQVEGSTTLFFYYYFYGSISLCPSSHEGNQTFMEVNWLTRYVEISMEVEIQTLTSIIPCKFMCKEDFRTLLDRFRTASYTVFNIPSALLGPRFGIPNGPTLGVTLQHCTNWEQGRGEFKPSHPFLLAGSKLIF